jgi:crotonobetaine/carnitine-CoA ligase
VEFVDRIKDCIRRRGENISAADLEATFLGLTGVSEVAAFAVPSGIEGGEDEIMLAIVPRPGSSIGGEAVAVYARERVPRFAWPRYVEMRAELPKTGTEKVRKEDLKRRGVTPAAIDLDSFYRARDSS